MTSFYVFIILYLTGFYQLINSESTTSTVSILNNTTTTVEGNEIDESTTLVFETTTTTIKPTERTTTTVFEPTVSLTTTSTIESTTSTIDESSSTKFSRKSRQWLIIAPILTIVVVIAIGIVHYYRRQSPYRRCIQWWELCKIRFLQGWRSRDDDTDNIILQLEQPEVLNDQWPPRISFA